MNKTITVRQLIERLRDEDQDARVVFASDYGDRGNTQQVHFLDGDIEEGFIERSAYSDSGWALADYDGDKPDDDSEQVLVLS